jgi:predicted amidohydrolase YtcJ
VFSGLLIGDGVRDPGGIHGDAVWTEDGRIVAIGRANDLRRPGLPECRLPGVIVPGLRDAHFHPVGYAATLQRPSLKEATDLAGVAEVLREAAAAHPPGTAVTALRLDDESLAEGRLPDRHFLDDAVPDHPVLLVRYCGHIAVANTRALDIAGIGPDTADPIGGTFDRDAGGPNGILRETAIPLVSRPLSALAPAIGTGQVIAAVTRLAAAGLTGLGAIVSLDEGLWGGGGNELETLLEAAPDIPLTLRVLVIAHTPEELRDAAIRLDAAGPRISFLGLKAFSDGSLGGHTAALFAPYADRPETSGTDRLDPEWMHEMSRTALDLGGRVAVHAIGDAANSRVLDGFERLLDDGADPGLLRIEHASVLADGDIDRLGRLGITACVQPAFLASETLWLQTRLGADRLERTYPFRSLSDAGVPLAGGSDCPVEPPHPLPGIAAARDRCGIVPAQALTAEEALALFTTGAAAAIGEDARLAADLPATLTVLDRDPVAADPRSLRECRVVATVVEGDEVPVERDAVLWTS